MQNVNRPWLNENGSFKSVEEIKKISQTWNSSQWEEYLKTLEGTQKESSLDKAYYIDQISNEDCADIFFSFIENDDYPHIRMSLEMVFRKLTKNERNVLRKVFWEGISKADIAKQSGISRAGVTRTYNRAMEKLKTAFLEHTVSHNSQKINHYKQLHKDLISKSGLLSQQKLTEINNSQFR